MKIDLVYCWVDGSDPAWRAKRGQYDAAMAKLDAETNCEARFENSDELRYSLRSVERYAPWINHIYIITDNQTPKWLDTSNPKITIVDHKEVLPAEALPTFNSTVIETGIANIESLSEYFLYANDDTMFGRDAQPSDFFTPEGKVITRVKIRQGKNFERFVRSTDKSTFANIIIEAARLVSNDFGVVYENYSSSHQIDAYSRSAILECNERYKARVEASNPHRFRSRDDFHRHAYSLYVLATGRGVARDLMQSKYAMILDTILTAMRLKKGVESLFKSIADTKLEQKIRQRRPLLLCLNDNEFCTDADRKRLKAMLVRLFPTKSSFEQ